MSSHLIRSDLVPILSGYLILMVILAAGLRLASRGQADRHSRRRGWPALLGHVAADAAGGYLVLAAVVVLYYYDVARVGGHFLESAFSGSALLLAVSLPVFGLVSWMSWRWQRRRRGNGR
jgi:hypothetical protein